MPTLALARSQDVSLMDTFVTHGISAAHLCILNDVRMFKRVTLLSDISTADGIYLDSTALTSHLPSRPTPYDWPRCTAPPPLLTSGGTTSRPVSYHPTPFPVDSPLPLVHGHRASTHPGNGGTHPPWT